MVNFGFSRRSEVPGSGDGTSVSISGLQWISGWVFDTSLDRSVLAVGLSQDKGAYGGPVFIVRDDVAAALKNPVAAKSGFAFPVPLELEVQSAHGGNAPILVALTTSSELQRLS
jgi:hypothetical protein